MFRYIYLYDSCLNSKVSVKNKSKLHSRKTKKKDLKSSMEALLRQMKMGGRLFLLVEGKECIWDR